MSGDYLTRDEIDEIAEHLTDQLKYYHDYNRSDGVYTLWRALKNKMEEKQQTIFDDEIRKLKELCP